MTAPSQTILEKLTKILAMADPSRGATQAEAETAMAKATALAIEHGINLATFQGTTSTKQNAKLETAKAEPTLRSQKRRPHHSPIAQVLEVCFDVRIVWFGKSARCVIIGETTDTAIAQFCMTWLDRLFPKMYTQYLHENKIPNSGRGEGEAARLTGFYRGLADGIKAANRRVREAMPRDQKDAYALVLVNKAAVVQARMVQEFPNLKYTTAKAKAIDYAAMQRGRDIGLGIKLNGGLTEGKTPANTLK